MNNSVERDDFLSPAAPSYAEATYSDTYDNPFETNIPQRMNSPSIEPDDVPLPGQKPLSPTKSPLPKVSGNIGSSSTSASASNNIGSNNTNASRGVGLGVGQAMMGDIDTLDEPVSETLVRIFFYSQGNSLHGTLPIVRRKREKKRLVAARNHCKETMLVGPTELTNPKITLQLSTPT